MVRCRRAVAVENDRCPKRRRHHQLVHHPHFEQMIGNRSQMENRLTVQPSLLYIRRGKVNRPLNGYLFLVESNTKVIQKGGDKRRCWILQFKVICYVLRVP